MARNESIAAVPTNVGDPDTLKRFLDRLVERLDIVLGYRGGDPYLTEGEQAETFNELQQLLSELRDTSVQLNESIEAVREKLTEAESRIEELEALLEYQTTSIVDLNSTAWTTAAVYSSFTALGSQILNPPAPLTGGLTYKCFVEVRASFVQRVTIVQVGAVATVINKTRAGSTWSELIANAWV